MQSKSYDLTLEPDQFALVFQTDAGVDAANLGRFLQRMATVARRKGVVIRVETALEGSLIVVLQAVLKEFSKAPVATGSAVSIAVVAVIAAMEPDKTDLTPLTKAGITLLEEGGVTSIEIISETKQTILLNGEIAQDLRKQETATDIRVLSERQQDVVGIEAEVRTPRRLEEFSSSGVLSGEVIEVDSAPYFRPDGHNYFIPVYLAPSQHARKMEPGRYFNVLGQIDFVDGQPESITVNSFERE